jgi:hypothetical protein
MGWDIEDDFDPDGSGWAKRVHSTIPRIEEDEMVLLRRLEDKIDGNDGVKSKSPRREDDECIGIAGNEVATEAEGAGTFRVGM